MKQECRTFLNQKCEMCECDCWTQALQSRPFKLAQAIWHSRIFRRLKAILSFLLYVADVGTDILVGYDLIGKCHVLYGAAAIVIQFLQGIIDGLQTLGFACYFGEEISSLRFLVIFLTPIWFLPVTAWKLFNDIVYINDDTKIKATM